MDRRVFVKSGALALVTMGLSPAFLRRTLAAAERVGSARGKVLVCLFQRGAVDALNMVVPHGDPAYYALRPRIAIARPARSAGDAGALDLDGFFGLHPALAPLRPLWDRGMLAPLHAVGSPSSTRSHFDAQLFMETATPDLKATPDGWLNRLLATTPPTAARPTPSPFRGVALSPQMPRALDGAATAISMSSIADFTVRAPSDDASRVEALYRGDGTDLVQGAGAEMFEAVRMLRAADPARYTPAAGADYPRSPLGDRLRQIAQLIKADVGLEIAFADVGGWDTHVNQGGATGQLANRFTDLARALAALVADLGDRMEDVVILTMSEFGRMARENGSGGTDHGHGGALFAIGGAVRGGRVHGTWPGLAREQLHEGRDLALTTDFRAVFAEVATRHLGATRLDAIFPGFDAAAGRFPGLLDARG